MGHRQKQQLYAFLSNESQIVQKHNSDTAYNINAKRLFQASTDVADQLIVDPADHPPLYLIPRFREELADVNETEVMYVVGHTNSWTNRTTSTSTRLNWRMSNSSGRRRTGTISNSRSISCSSTSRSPRQTRTSRDSRATTARCPVPRIRRRHHALVTGTPLDWHIVNPTNNLVVSPNTNRRVTLIPLICGERFKVSVYQMTT